MLTPKPTKKQSFENEAETPLPKAKKSLGQNFLQNKEVLERISNTLNIESDDTIIEIGPGHGELTEYLLKKQPKELILIEKDDVLAKSLTDKFQITNEKHASRTRIQIINGDALEVIPNIWHLDFGIKTSNNLKIVGNIPYYITGQLFRVIGEMAQKPQIIVLMIQKEVAERVSSSPRKTSILSASVQIWADCEIMEYVGKEMFHPKPKVDSAIIRLKTKDSPLLKKPELPKYYELLHALFKQPRKTIWNNLKDSNTSKEQLKNLGIRPEDRPQNLNISQIVELSRSIDLK